MKIDYDVGDAVVCVDDRPSDNPFYTLQGNVRRGSVHRVLGFPHPNGVILDNAFTPNPSGTRASRFRKLPKADAEFTEMLRAIKPVKQVEPA